MGLVPLDQRRALLLLLGASIGIAAVVFVIRLRTDGRQRAAPRRGTSPAEVHMEHTVREVSESQEIDPSLPSSDVLQDVDFTRIESPPQFRGTTLEWRLHGRIENAELARLLRTMKGLAPREQRALLGRVGRAPDPTLAESLVSAKAELSDGPRSNRHYAYAALAMLAVIHKNPRIEAEMRRSTEDLAEKFLEAIARIAGRFGRHLSESGWSGIYDLLRRFRRIAPKLWDEQPYRGRIDEVRTAVNTLLREAALPEPNYRGGLAAVKVATLVAGEDTRHVFLSLLRAREVFIQKIEGAASRRDIAFVNLVSRSVIDGGTRGQWGELAAILENGLSGADLDAKMRLAFGRLAAYLLRTVPKDEPFGFRQTLEQILAKTK